MQTRIFNDFKQRLIAGDVPSSFNCQAYLLNSNYEKITENPMYMRYLSDFNKFGNTEFVLNQQQHVVQGNSIASGAVIKNTYFRMPDVSDEDVESSQYAVVTSANVSAFSALLGVPAGTTFSSTRFADYLGEFSYFYFVTRADEFRKLVNDCKDNDYETFAVVLGDDIEHVSINSTCFGPSRQHPFRGVFDGNGYSLHVSTLNAGTRSNGIFGYIAETGRVKNLKILCDETSNKDNKAIYITNTTDISLSTIKNGAGDVKVGILAGTNNGTIENVVLSANIVHRGEYTPEFYFVQNKGSNTTLISEAWKKLPINEQNNLRYATHLSAFDNFFYPTMLCVNSIANIIPYVGYFNEGAISTGTVPTDHSDKLRAFYSTYSGQYYHMTNDCTEPNSNYYTMMPDLAWYQHDMTDAKIDAIGGKRKSDWNHCLFGAQGYGSNWISIPQMTTRLGPNNKQAYLIGGLVGNNNGDIVSASVVTDVTFSANLVGLVGGVAGRSSRGKISDVYVSANFNGTPEMYNTSAAIDVGPTVTASTAKITFDELLYNTTQLDIAELYAEYTNDDVKLRSPNLEPDIVSIHNGVGVHISADAAYIARIHITADSISVLASASDDEPIFSDPVNHSSEYKHVVTLEQVSAALSDEGTITVEYTNKDSNTTGTYDLDVYFAELKHGYAAIAGNNRVATALNEQGKFSIVTQDGHPTGQELEINSYVNLKASGTDRISGQNVNVFCTIDIPFSDLSTKPLFYSTDTNFLTKAYEEQQYILLSPVYNVGGMFGEFVYANKQSVNNSYVKLNVKNFKSNNDVHSIGHNITNGFSAANCFSTFSPNIVIDSSNKSNCDIYADTYASADCVVKNKLRCYTVENSVTTVNNSDDCCQTVEFAQYTHVYNQIAPALVSTQYTFKDHDKAKTYPPVLGIVTTDQTFYHVGINMGSDADVARNPDAMGNWLMTPSNSGIYFNFAAQKSRYNKQKDASSYDKSLWTRTGFILGAAFSDYHVNQGRATKTYTTNQLTRLPAYYPLYRGRAAVTTNDAGTETRFTFIPTAYNSWSFTCPTASNSTFVNGINAIVNNVEHSRSKESNPYYVYSHSAEVLNTGCIKPVNLTMYYADHYGIANTHGLAIIAYTEQELQTYRTAIGKITSAYEADMYRHKGYLMSSSKYQSLAVESPVTKSRIYYEENGSPITANTLAYGFIPRSADIVRALDEAEDETLVCYGLSADDLQYMLIVDNLFRPIMDIKLDATAVDNAGYYVSFPSAYSHTSGEQQMLFSNATAVYHNTTVTAGEAINIETDN